MNYKKILWGIGLSCSIFAASAETYMDDPNNVLYVNPVTCQAGSQATLDVYMKNEDANISAFQFDLYLPEGFTVDYSINGDRVISAVMSLDRFNPAKFTFSTSFPESGNYQHLTVLCYSSTDGKVIGNDGVVATVTLNVDEGLAAGDYSFTLKNTVTSTKANTYMKTTDINGTITVTSEEKTYAEGYSLDIVPFRAEASKAYTLVLNMTCATEEVTDIEFDVTMPSILARTKSGRANKAPDFANDERIYTDDHSISMDANGHVSIQAICDDEYRMIAGTSGSLVNLYYTAAASIAEGIHQLELTNIKMTLDDGTVLEVAPYTADIYVGNPTATPNPNGIVAYHGNYDDADALALLNASLATEGVTTIDLTAVTAVAEGKTINTTNNPNALIITKTDLGIANDANVVVDGTCANLVLTDKQPFFNTKEFAASNVSYSRTMTDHQWGTLVLPFEAKTNTTAQVYNMTNVSTGGEGVMTVEETDAVSAYVPCIIKKLDGDVVTFTANDVTIPATSTNAMSAETGVQGWTLKGTMSALKYEISTQSLFFINSDCFWKAKNELTIDPFRAYFETSGSAPAKFRIEDGTNGIETIMSDEKSDIFYDLQGRIIKAPQSGQIYIQHANKILAK